jgi:hypothetical protein
MRMKGDDGRSRRSACGHWLRSASSATTFLLSSTRAGVGRIPTPDCRRPSVVNGIDKAPVTSIHCSKHKPFYELGSWVGGRSPGPSIIHDAPRTSGRREKVKLNNTI